jgi:hypothetical protein
VDRAAGCRERAKKSPLHALETAPNHAAAHFNLAGAYEEAGELTRAVQHSRAFLGAARPEHAPQVAEARRRVQLLQPR